MACDRVRSSFRPRGAALPEAAGRFSDCGPVKRKAGRPSGVMVLFEVTWFAPQHGIRWWSSPMYGSGCAECSASHRPARDRPTSAPSGLRFPPPGGNSGQAMASFFHLNSVSFFHNVSINTASFRAVATAALAKPRRPESRTAQLFNAENFCTRPIKVVAASNSRLRMVPSPHLEMRPDQSISPD